MDARQDHRHPASLYGRSGAGRWGLIDDPRRVSRGARGNAHGRHASASPGARLDFQHNTRRMRSHISHRPARHSSRFPFEAHMNMSVVLENRMDDVKAMTAADFLPTYDPAYSRIVLFLFL